MIELKVVRNYILNNIDLHDQLFKLFKIHPVVTKIFQIRKIQIVDKSDRDTSDFIIECFSRDESCQK